MNATHEKLFCQMTWIRMTQKNTKLKKELGHFKDPRTNDNGK